VLDLDKVMAPSVIYYLNYDIPYMRFRSNVHVLKFYFLTV